MKIAGSAYDTHLKSYTHLCVSMYIDRPVQVCLLPHMQIQHPLKLILSASSHLLKWFQLSFLLFPFYLIWFLLALGPWLKPPTLHPTACNPQSLVFLPWSQPMNYHIQCCACGTKPNNNCVLHLTLASFTKSITQDYISHNIYIAWW